MFVVKIMFGALVSICFGPWVSFVNIAHDRQSLEHQSTKKRERERETNKSRETHWFSITGQFKGKRGKGKQEHVECHQSLVAPPKSGCTHTK